MFIILKKFSFWGSFFLLVLLIGFKINIGDVMYEAICGRLYINVWCIYMLISIVSFPIMATFSILNGKRKGISIVDTIAISLPSILWIPYRGFDINGFFKLKNENVSKEIMREHIIICCKSTVELIIWWIIVLSLIYSIVMVPNNKILYGIMKCNTQQILMILIYVVIIIIVLNCLAWLFHLFVFMNKKW